LSTTATLPLPMFQNRSNSAISTIRLPPRWHPLAFQVRMLIWIPAVVPMDKRNSSIEHCSSMPASPPVEEASIWLMRFLYHCVGSSTRDQFDVAEILPPLLAHHQIELSSCPRWIPPTYTFFATRHTTHEFPVLDTQASPF
jgi:hypothetical protein